MKILALSNLYPPGQKGGEELSAKSIVDGLRSRGHQVDVITTQSDHELNEACIYRELEFEMDSKPLRSSIRFFLQRKTIIRRDLAVLSKYYEKLKPDLILIFSLWNIPRQVPALAEALLPGRVVYRLGSYWPTLGSQYASYWGTPARSGFSKVPKLFLSHFARRILEKETLPDLRIDHAICISQSVCDEFKRLGYHLADVQIILNGIKLENFQKGVSPWLKDEIPQPIRLLYVGRISPEKGVHTIVEAFARLARRYPTMGLSIAGSRWDPGYQDSLLQAIVDLDIEDKVNFIGNVPPNEIPDLMYRHNVLIVPSIWEEPFGRVVLEGMAAGMVVIGTATGGMKVALQDGITGLVFPPEDVEALVARVERLLDESDLGKKLVQQAAQMVVGFSEQKMVSEYEKALNNLLEFNCLSNHVAVMV